VALLRRTLETETIPMHVLYEAPTVRALARLMQQDQTEGTAAIAERFTRGGERRKRLKERRSGISPQG